MQFAKARSIYIYIYIKFYGPFLGMGCNCLKARHSHYEEKKFLVLIRSISERWKTEMTLKPFSGFELVYQPSYYQIEIKVTIQTDSFMTLNSEHFQSEFSVLSGRLIKNIFPLLICGPNDYTIEIIVLLQIQFYNIFTNVLSNIFKRFH